MNLTEQLKAKILEAPSVNSVAVASGVPQPVLNRFVRGRPGHLPCDGEQAGGILRTVLAAGWGDREAHEVPQETRQGREGQVEAETIGQAPQCGRVAGPRVRRCLRGCQRRGRDSGPASPKPLEEEGDCDHAVGIPE